METYSSANAVSKDGKVVVGMSLSNSNYEYEAFRWENGKMQGLGDLPGGRDPR
jgi:probable HAF family extracellular repeat protein